MQAMPATTNESISAGPVLSCAATPVRTKMPVPMMAPTPSAGQRHRAEHALEATRAFAFRLFEQQVERLGRENIV